MPGKLAPLASHNAPVTPLSPPPGQMLSQRNPTPYRPLRRLCPRFLHPSLRKSPSRAVLFALKSSEFRPSRQLTFTTTREVHHAPLDAEMDIDKRFKILREKLEELGFNSGDCKPGQYTNKMCPKCEGGESKEKSLSLHIREDGRVAMWTCFRENCSWRGCIQDGKMLNVGSSQTLKSKKYRALTEADLRLEPLSEETLAYFKKRMISTGTLQRNAIMQRRYKTETVIAFPYRRNGMLVSCKYRGIIDKKFRQESNTERVFYGLDDIRDAREIIIVEGEMDKLAMEEAGYPNCVSVPDGAPGKVSENLPDEEKDTKFQYLWNCEEYLNQASRIVLATDADAPGQALAEELARRLGKERCWRVNWPTESGQVCKDANEVLMHKGLDALREVIENAKFYPIGGLFNYSSFFPEIDDYYYCRNGYARGVSTGWRALNNSYNVVPGELTVITGVPSSGKSEWIDALLCNINKSEGWTFAQCSMENKAPEHARRPLEKHIGKPFFDASYGGSADCMSDTELKQGKECLKETFYLIWCEDDSLPSVDWVLNLANNAVIRYGVRGLVIDPYNELDHQRPANQMETEYVSQMLTLSSILHSIIHVMYGLLHIQDRFVSEMYEIRSLGILEMPSYHMTRFLDSSWILMVMLKVCRPPLYLKFILPNFCAREMPNGVHYIIRRILNGISPSIFYTIL